MLNRKQLREGCRLHILSYRDEPECVTGNIVEIRDCHEAPIRFQQHVGDIKTRSRFLITVELDKEKEGSKYRSYYHAFVEAKEVPLG